MEDVVVYRVDVDNREVLTSSWGRGNVAEVEAFCRHPKWPAKRTDAFVGVDGWGYNTGTIVAATPELSMWIGKTFAEFKSAVH